MNKILIFLLLAHISSANGVEIENFRSGLACTDGETFGWICHEVAKVHVTGQSKCTYNNEINPCTWHGFEFDYKNHDKETTINCTLSTSYPVSLGNPDEITDSKVTETSYVLPIEPGGGHFFNPQYVVLAARSEPPFSRFEHTERYAGTKKIFEFSREYVYPKNP